MNLLKFTHSWLFEELGLLPGFVSGSEPLPLVILFLEHFVHRSAHLALRLSIKPLKDIQAT